MNDVQIHSPMPITQCMRLDSRNLLSGRAFVTNLMVGIIGCGLLSGTARAEWTPADWLDVRSFGTIGLVHNNDSDVEFVRNLTQSDADGDSTSLTQDTVFGVQLDARISDQLSATLQSSTKYRHDGDFGSEISWLFLKYRPTPDLDIRFGRMGLDLFFRSDSQDIGYSFTWVRPPHDFYGTVAFSQFDGIDLTKNLMLARGYLKLKAFAGELNESFAGERLGNLDFDGSPIRGVIGEYTRGNFTGRLSAARMGLEGQSAALDQLTGNLSNLAQLTMLPQLAELAQGLRLSDQDLDYLSLAIAYDKGPWGLLSSIAQMSTDMLLFTDNTAWFTSLSYRHGRFKPYVYASGLRSERTPPVSTIVGGPILDAQINALIEGTRIHQSTVGFGVRTEIATNLAFKAQVDIADSRARQSLFWRNETPAWDGDVTLLSLALDFVF